MKHTSATGHLSAAFTVLVWGTTFISTKILLRDFQPLDILFLRFVMGYAALFLARPGRLRLQEKRQELLFILAGLCGVYLYYLLENIALTYTMASNVGVILSTAPIFTALTARLAFRGEEKLRPSFFVGFAAAMAGIYLISLNGSALQLNPRGDLLALLAALVWAFYSIIIRKINALGFPVVRTTRRIFGWGLFFMLPTLPLLGFSPDLGKCLRPVNLCNFLFLGLCASALCFVTWNFAVKILGAVKTSVYIYLTPVVTVVTSVLVLHERITLLAAAGTVMTLAGLVLSNYKPRQREK